MSNKRRVATECARNAFARLVGFAAVPGEKIAIVAGVLLLAAISVVPPALSAELERANDRLYREGWRASQLIGKPVHNNEKRIGEVSDLVIDGNGDLERLIIHSHGLIATGESNLGVVWPLVTLAQDLGSVIVPVSEEFASLYNADRVVLSPNRWSVKRLLGARVVVDGSIEYGRMDDVIFDRQGQLRAIIVAPASPDGTLAAIPWRAVRVAEDHRFVDVPLKIDELARYDDFRYERMGSTAPSEPPSGAPK